MSFTSSVATRVDAPELEKTDNVKEGVVCAVVVLALAGVLTAVGLYMSFWPSDMDGENSGSSVPARNDPLCQGSQCADATARLKAIMKTDEDPCENFYRFVCGNYRSPSRQMLAQMEDEMYASLVKALEAARFPPSGQTGPEKAAALYKACSVGIRRGDVDDSAFVARFMENVGLTARTYDSAEPLDKMVMLFFRYNLDSVLDLSLVDTRLYRGHRVLRVGLSTAQLYWLGNRGSADANSFYHRHLGPFGLNPKSTQASEVAGEIINAETIAIAELLGHSNPDESSGEFIYMVPELNDLARCETANWGNLISKYSSNAYGANDEVLVQKPDIIRFANLCRYLGNRRLSLLVAWELLRTLMPLSSPGVAMHYKEETARHMCLRAVERAMEVPLLSWYLFKEVPPGVVARAKEMADYTRKSILEEIDSSTWLDGTTKQAAINKVYSMRLHVGYPSHFASRKEIERFYGSYPDVDDSFLKPWQEAMKKTVRWMTVDNSSFWFSVASTNALYLPMRNRIVVPATVLRLPMFSSSAPKAFTYGGLGAVLGHEMTHAFDLVGSTWDARGRKRDWWTASSRQLYDGRLGCLRRSHGAAQSDADSENMADFAGLVSSYNAYANLGDKQKLEELPYDAEQLFFISSCVKWCAADRAGHSKRYAPWQDRCNVPLRNMEEFADAFQCAQGSAMRPAQRCAFW